MNIKASTIIIGSVLFAVGGILGFVLGVGVQEEIPRTPLEKKVGELEKSQVTRDLCANFEGEVVEIAGNVLTLSKEGDLLKMEVDPEARVSRQILPEEQEGEITRKEIKFEEIKVGDYVYVYSVLTKEGRLIARNIMALLLDDPF